jgi:carboxyl-terminal processing protease
VTSDIKLPSLFDQAEIGESSLKGPLAYDTVEPVPFDKWDKPLFKGELAKRSAARVAVDPEFGYITEDLNRLKKRLAENKISLNEKERRAELDEDKAKKEKRTASRSKLKQPEQKVFTVTLDNVSKPELQLVKNDEEKKPEKAATADDVADDSTDVDAADDESPKTPRADPVRNEAMNILGDLVELSRLPKTASRTAAAASN